ncbi:MAG TPA: Crp/Fnr family transcriptional regulator [Thermoanaerobaculia bacterium]|jgi:CRP-like cAMP-binding protein
MTEEADRAGAREDNALLAALPTRQRNDAHRSSKLFSLEFGATILVANTRSRYAYFPIRGAVSLVRTLSSGPTVEVGVIGNEGVVGVDIFMEAPAQLNDAIVQGGGSAWQMPAEDLLARFRRNGEMQRQLLRFTNAFITQVSQTAACNRAHAVEARLARWLLMMQDRVAAPQIRMTQQFLAHMLGARTASVNEAVQKLEAAGVIGHRRQEISVLDREGLEGMACECYAIVCRVYAQAILN